MRANTERTVRVLPRLALVPVLLLCGARFDRAVVHIDQAAALAGGVTPGDAPGFPVTLSEPGSYLVTSNLTVHDFDRSGIEIAADGITLDLGGFVLRGPCSVVLPGGGCEPAGTGSGIRGTRSRLWFGLVVTHGQVLGFPANGVAAGSNARISDLHVAENGRSGIHVHEGQVVGCTTIGNGGGGIDVDRGRALSNVVANNNNGITTNGAVEVTGNLISANRRAGVSALEKGLIRENTIWGNRFGTSSLESVLLRGNSVQGNSEGGVSGVRGVSISENVIQENGGFNVIGIVDAGGNLCDGQTTCP